MYDDYIDTENCSLTEICKKYNIENKERFINYLKRRGLKIKSMSEVRSYVTNPNFFEIIDSEIKAYLLGFFSADGHIEKRKDYDSYTLRVGVKLDDLHILKLYIKYISQKTVISCTNRMASIAITCKKIGEDLLKMGFNNNKTYTWKNIPKEVPNSLIHHFIRGYFDGDGSSMVNRRRLRNRIAGYNTKINFVCYNKSILEDIISFFNLEKYSLKLKENNSNSISGVIVNFKDCWMLDITNRVEITKMYNILYKDANYYFKRKKDKFELCCMDSESIDAALQGNL